ncbi:hypothetical protein [Caulobacter sp. NIBR1757]|uniref:hypothetical protein n=1 Tax=Caulobacter sp. NIBR1757 TaxID=3016000 RepID=UPI0022F0A5DA|nr:hypothetical protein [Caulobacter sp. NIBR1757]
MAPSLIDQLSGPAAEQIFRERPGLSRFATSGSPDAKVYPDVATELKGALERTRAMMAAESADWSEVLEVRISTRNEADREAAIAVIAEYPEVARLPVSFSVVNKLPATRARVSLDVVAEERH